MSTKTILDYLKQYGAKKHEEKKQEVKTKYEEPPRSVEKRIDKTASVEKRVRTKKKPKIKIRIWDLKGNILVIAEKPKAASKIAYALSTRHRKNRWKGIPYYIISNNGSNIIIASAAGHLYGLYTNKYGYPVFQYEWRPLYEIDQNAKHTKKFIELLDKLSRKADHYVNACDYDIEGSVIGYLVIKFMGDPSRAYRVKYSSLTPAELKQAFKELTELDYEMIEAGLCRHELDWIWGINISRALMDAVRRSSGKRTILSAGRVQTPTLKHVVDHEVLRNLFIPLPLFMPDVTITKDGEKIHLEYVSGSLETRREAEEVIRAIKKQGYLLVTEYNEKTLYLNPPPAFNLGDLQEEAARIYGFSPYKTQRIAEKLYLDALISYPRTNSQKLPPTLNYRGIIDKLSRINNYGPLIDKLLKETKGVLKPVQGKKDDPAHPAIYPTGLKPGKLSSDEWKIYDLIVRRFLAAFADKAILIQQQARFRTVQGYEFRVSGQRIARLGWLYYYYFSKPKEKSIPVFTRGEQVRVLTAKLRKTYTRPPEKLSKIKILRWMEKVEIGTEATRARIIELLFRRGYLASKGGKVVATDLGLGIIEVLTKYFPQITSVEMTRHFEEKMEDIRYGKARREEVVEEARRTIIKLLEEFDRVKDKIGLLLSIRLGYLSPQRKCLICNREEYRDGLCYYHYLALEKIREAYKEWSRREEITIEKFVKTIKKMRSTGKWIVEILSNDDVIARL